jgi:beta-lactam-binding protein with PASTA domain
MKRLAAAIIFILFIASWTEAAAPMVTVPDVRGGSLSGAMKQLQSVGLKGKVVGYVEVGTDKGYLWGNVASQDPPISHKVPKGSTVNLKVYKKYVETKAMILQFSLYMPNEAVRELNKAGFKKVRVIRDSYTRYPAHVGKVFKTTPSAGSWVEQSTLVTVHVYKAVGN